MNHTIYITYNTHNKHQQPFKIITQGTIFTDVKLNK